MTDFLVDTVRVESQVNLVDRAGDELPESGGNWISVFGGSPICYPALNKVIAGAGGLNIARYSVIAPSADVSIQNALRFDSYNFNNIGDIARAAADGSSGYGWVYSAASKTYLLFRLGALSVSGPATTILAESAVINYVTSDTPNVIFEVTGTGPTVTLKLKVNGSEVVSFQDSDVSLRVVTAGYVGVWISAGTAGSGMFIDSITASDVAAQGGGGGGSGSVLTLTSPLDGRIFPRTGTAGIISAAFDYTGTPSTIEARLVLDGTNTVVGADWSAKVATPSNNTGVFSMPPVADGVWYNLQLRDSANPSVVVTSGKVGVGALIAFLGQSNAYLNFARGDSTLLPNPKVRVIGSGSDNGIASDNAAKTWAVPATASMNGAIAFGNRMATALNTLIGLIDVTWDGSGLTVPGNGGQWIPTTTAGSPYQRLKAFLNTITTKIEQAVIVNGETDAAQGVPQPNFYAGQTILIDTLRTDFGSPTMPIITPLLGKRTDAPQTITDAKVQAIRNAQVQKAGDTAIFRVEREDLPLASDEVHHTAPGFTKLGDRCGQAGSYAAGKVSFYRGMRLVSVAKVDASNFVGTLSHGGGNDFSGHSGFDAVDGNNVIAVTASRLSGTQVQFALASPAQGMPTFRYLYGTAPDVSAPLLDNSALSLPLEFNDGVVATEAQAASPTPKFPVMVRYKDRVRDTSQSTSAQTIVVSGTAPTGHKSFAEYPIGTSGIPVYFGDQNNGANWITGLATRSGVNTLTVDTILTSSAGGSAPTFGAGTKDVYVAPLASLTARKHYIDLADYDVYPNADGDSTAGFQQAIFDALARGISMIFIPDGHYLIGGPLGVGNAQIYIPNTRQNELNKALRFVGASQPNLETQGLLSMIPTMNGVIIESTLRITSGSGAIIAGEAGNAGDEMRWNYTNVGFSNIGFRTKVDTGMNNMSALDLSMFSQVTEFDKIRIDVNVPIISSPDPTAGGSYGVIWPPVDNHAQFHIGTALVTGHANGMRIGEHFDAKRLTFLGCNTALVLTGGNHGSSITHLLVECCKTSMRVDGNHPLSIQTYSTEHNQDGNWFDFVSDLNHVSGNRKVVILQSTVITSHIGINDAGFTTNATSANLKIIAGAGAN